MRILTAVLGVMLLVNVGYAAEVKALDTEKDKLSYSIGMDIGNNLKRQSIDVDADILTRGIKDTLEGEKQLLTEEEFRTTMENFKNNMMAKQQTQMKEIAEKMKKEGETFLAANKKKEGVVVTPSGLQYKVIKKGEGDMPKATDTVTVHY